MNGLRRQQFSGSLCCIYVMFMASFKFCQLNCGIAVNFLWKIIWRVDRIHKMQMEPRRQIKGQGNGRQMMDGWGEKRNICDSRRYLLTLFFRRCERTFHSQLLGETPKAYHPLLRGCCSICLLRLWKSTNCQCGYLVFRVVHFVFVSRIAAIITLSNNNRIIKNRIVSSFIGVDFFIM